VKSLPPARMGMEKTNPRPMWPLQANKKNRKLPRHF
jgi:hypothetical protein